MRGNYHNHYQYHYQYYILSSLISPRYCLGWFLAVSEHYYHCIRNIFSLKCLYAICIFNMGLTLPPVLNNVKKIVIFVQRGIPYCDFIFESPPMLFLLIPSWERASRPCSFLAPLAPQPAHKVWQCFLISLRIIFWKLDIVSTPAVHNQHKMWQYFLFLRINFFLLISRN